MSVLGELLFFRRDGVDLDAVLRHQGDAGLRQLIDGIPEREISGETEDVLVARYLAKASVEPLTVAWEQGQSKVVEITMDTQSVFREAIRVEGLRATKSFSFSGDRDLWYLRTNPYDMNPPRGLVSGRTLTVGIEVRDHEGDQAAGHIDSSVRQIKEWLQRQEAQIAAFNAILPTRIMPLLQRRRATISKASDLLKKLQG